MANHRRNSYRAVLLNQRDYTLSLATSVAARADTTHTNIERAIFLKDRQWMAQLHSEVQDSPAIRELLTDASNDLCKAMGWPS